MNILVIGAGNMGSGFVKQLHAAGYQVRVATRQADKAAGLAAQYPGVQAVPLANAASDVDAVIVATGYADAVAALRSVGSLTGKVVVVTGYLMVTIKKAWSMLAAMMCDSFDRLGALRIM